ncbi:hypothetical protein HDU76_012559 [Blyttiomyces sp. JEL0837]|nr:hypothetical protein HDU76_012559 [Blyttiomyces sp. JEL0837]
MAQTQRLIEQYNEVLEDEASYVAPPSDWIERRASSFGPGRVRANYPNQYLYTPHDVETRAVDCIRHHRFSLLDDVFDCFIRTNAHRGANWSLQDMLTRSSYDRRGFRFVHLDTLYRAEVFLYRGEDADWVNIKLVNNGFSYIPKAGRLVPPRHNADGWVLVALGTDDVVLDRFCQHINAVPNSPFTSTRIFYNNKHHRLDIKVYSQVADVPHVLVTFEDGYPYYDESVPSTPLRQQ